MQRLEQRIAVVTGAASGIGLAVTEAFAAEGMRVVMADLDESTLREHGVIGWPRRATTSSRSPRTFATRQPWKRWPRPPWRSTAHCTWP